MCTLSFLLVKLRVSDALYHTLFLLRRQNRTPPVLPFEVFLECFLVCVYLFELVDYWGEAVQREAVGAHVAVGDHLVVTDAGAGHLHLLHLLGQWQSQCPPAGERRRQEIAHQFKQDNWPWVVHLFVHRRTAPFPTQLPENTIRLLSCLYKQVRGVRLLEGTGLHALLAPVSPVKLTLEVFLACFFQY